MSFLRSIVTYLTGQRKAQRSERMYHYIPRDFADLLDANLAAGRLVCNRWPAEAGHGWGG